MTREQARKRNFVTRIIFIIAGLSAIVWTQLTPDPSDLNWTLLILWTLLAARGVFKAGKILRRVRIEHSRVDPEKDLQGHIIATGNMRRNGLLFLAMLAFLVIGLSAVIGESNITLSRLLIVLILVALEALLEFDDDEIHDFDRVTELQERINNPQPDPPADYDIPQ